MKRIILLVLMTFTLAICKGQAESEKPNEVSKKSEINLIDAKEEEVYLADLKFTNKEIAKRLNANVSKKNHDGKLISLQAFEYNSGYIVLVSDFESTQSFLYYYNSDLKFTGSKEFDVQVLKKDWTKIKL